MSDIRMSLTREIIPLGTDSSVLSVTLRVFDQGESYHGFNSGPYDDLVVRAQAHMKSGDAEFYGWSVVYRQPYEVNLDRAETMVKTLRKVNRHMEKLTTKFGSPQNFAEYVGRVADALGAASDNPFGVPSTMYPDGQRWTNVDGLRYELEKMAA